MPTTTATITLTSPSTTIDAASLVLTVSGPGVYGPPGTAWTLTNNGVIDSLFGAGVTLASGGSIDNQSRITGLTAGLAIAGTAGLDSFTLTNAGTITGGVGIVLAASLSGAQLHNFAGATIQGTTAGVQAAADHVTLTTSGYIAGTNGDAVAFTGADDLLVMDAAASFHGNVDGGPSHSSLELTGAAQTRST